MPIDSTMTNKLRQGDVLLMTNGNVGVIRDMHKNRKFNTCIVEIKGEKSPKPNDNKPLFQQQHHPQNLIHLKLNKKNHKPHKSEKQDFTKLSGELLYDKLSFLVNLVNDDLVHGNTFKKLKEKHDNLQHKVKQKDIELDALRDQIKDTKKHLLLQQSIWTITHPKNIDKTSSPVLLLTFPTFTNNIELLNSITTRFFNLNHDDYQQRLHEKQWEVQIKCISFLQQWIRTYWIEDFYFDASMIELINDFSERILTVYGSDNVKYRKLSDMIQKTVQFQREQEIHHTFRDFQRQETFTLMIEDIKVRFQEIDNRRIAEQMTLIDFSHFQAIKPRECLNKNWLNEDHKYSLAPNICDMINSLNRTFKWCQITILLADDVGKRGRLIKKFLKICRHLLELQNFHSLSAIFGALRSTPVYRLKEAWKWVPQKHIAFYNELVVLFDTKRNMGNLRETHKKSYAPMVPYTGIFLTELVGIEEGNKDSTEKKAINFAKLVMISNSIDRVLIYQKTGYEDIKQDVPMQHFLNKEIYHDTHNIGSLDEDYLYECSKSAAKQDEEAIEEKVVINKMKRSSSHSLSKISSLFKFKSR